MIYKMACKTVICHFVHVMNSSQVEKVKPLEIIKARRKIACIWNADRAKYEIREEKDSTMSL